MSSFDETHENEILDESPLDKQEAIEQSTSVLKAFLAESGETISDADLTEAAVHNEDLPEGHQSGFVAVIGRPNVGKSTLLNALVGEKVAIVSKRPQTTRTRVTGIVTQDMYQLIFVDTPGIHIKASHELNKVMNETAIGVIPDADVILFVVDVSLAPREEDEMIAGLLAEKAKKRPVFFVLNKMDKLSMAKAKQRIESYWALLPGYTDSIPVSALDGTNIELLSQHILQHIPEGPRYFPGGQITDQTERHIAAELIREAMLTMTYQEVPHSAAVLVEEYEQRENGVTHIDARIWVERPSQKSIVIGKQGQMLKKIGTAARLELERFIGGRVYLDLWVKVQPGWRDHHARLRELGF